MANESIRVVLALTLLLASVTGASPGELPAQDLDLLFLGGRVVDGSGNPAIRADVGILGDRITAVGDLRSVSAARVIDARGLTVVPGFIDIHSHADAALVSESLELRRAPNLVAQGITTVVGGPDGMNAVWPVENEMAAVRRLGTAVNFVPMVGHGAVRSHVMGPDYERHATPAEIDRMKTLVRSGMEAGAWGLGAGLEYRPGRFSQTEELIELAHVVAEYDGFYIAHQRSQSPLPLHQVPSLVKGMPITGTDGMGETIRIGRESRIRVVGTHIKAKGPEMWGQAAKDVIRIDRAREEDIQVFLDQYPYETFGGSGHRILPPWAFAPPGTGYSGGLDDPRWSEAGIFSDFRANLRANLDDPTIGPILREDIEYLIRVQGGANRLIIMDVPDHPELVGRTLEEVSAERGLTPVETLVWFAREYGSEEVPHGVLFRGIAGHPFDVATYMKQPYTATSTDATVTLDVTPGLHPRFFGTFVHKLTHYVREQEVLSLPFAIRSATSLPAAIIGLPHRGFVRPGCYADIVVFDHERLEDRSTIFEPGQQPEGVHYVLVNGRFTLDEGYLTGATPGRVLRRKELRARPTSAEDPVPQMRR